MSLGKNVLPIPWVDHVSAMLIGDGMDQCNALVAQCLINTGEKLLLGGIAYMLEYAHGNHSVACLIGGG